MEVSEKPKKKRKKLPKAVKGEEFVQIMKCVPQGDKIAKVSFILSYGAGLRISEVVKLRKEHIDEIRNTISIWDAKGGVDRTVPLPKFWRKWMFAYLPIPKSIRTLERKFRKYSAKAKLPSFYTFHSLRHGFATRLIEKGVPITHVQTLLGHSDVSTTGVYIKARPMDALQSYEESF